MKDKMNRRYDLKGREAFLQELEVFFQYKEEMLDEGFYSETEFGDAILDTIFDFFEEAESEWKLGKPFGACIHQLKKINYGKRRN